MALVLDRAAAPTEAAPTTRVIDAALRCIARWGVAKTTLDDVAREAGCSRATVYRLFPGGRDALLDAVTATEVARFFVGLNAELADASTIEETVTVGVHRAAEAIARHEALRFVLAHEPEVLLPRLSFARLDAVLAGIAGFAAPQLRRWLDGEEALRAGEWIARVVLSYLLCPSPSIDLTDRAAAQRFVHTYIVPGLTARVPT